MVFKEFVPFYQWKVVQIIMIQKSDKNIKKVTSYRLISLLLIPSKMLERLLLTRLANNWGKKLIPEYQFGFRQKHSTLDQVHRIIDKTHSFYEAKKYCSIIFLDVS